MKHDIVSLVRASALDVRAATMLARILPDKRVTTRAMALICDAAEKLDEAVYEIEFRNSPEWIKYKERITHEEESDTSAIRVRCVERV